VAVEHRCAYWRLGRVGTYSPFNSPLALSSSPVQVGLCVASFLWYIRRASRPQKLCSGQSHHLRFHGGSVSGAPLNTLCCMVVIANSTVLVDAKIRLDPSNSFLRSQHTEVQLCCQLPSHCHASHLHPVFLHLPLMPSSSPAAMYSTSFVFISTSVP
jgi:hypothetical protein